MYFKMAPLSSLAGDRSFFSFADCEILWEFKKTKNSKKTLSIVLVQWYDSLQFSSMLSVVQSCGGSYTWLCFDELRLSLSSHLLPEVGSDSLLCVLTSLIGLGKADYILVSFILSFSFFVIVILISFSFYWILTRSRHSKFLHVVLEKIS